MISASHNPPEYNGIKIFDHNGQKITANLENVSVKAALDVILKPNGYSYFTQENIIIVKGADNQIKRELETLILKLKYINSLFTCYLLFIDFQKFKT